MDLQPEPSAVWVRFLASAFGLDKELFMPSMYILPGGSQQLHEPPIAAGFQLLSITVSDALQPVRIRGKHAWEMLRPQTMCIPA